MAQVVLSSIGSAVGGPVGGAIGSTLGRYVDRRAIASLAPARQVGPRLEGLQLTSTAEGAPMAAAFGRARVAGQVIWAARFKEAAVEGRDGGGKGGPRTVDYAYSLSFAVALCEGPIDGIGRIWADGKPMDQAGVALRVYLGDEAQTPDPLIEAVEGQAPAYRGLAYLVFEDLALGAYGDRPPQLMVEVFRRPKPAGAGPALEDRLTGVCLIPGAGEFVYATEPVLRRLSVSRFASENVNNLQGRPDFLVSLDQLMAAAPNLEEVTLVVAWFGDDLRCGECSIRPGVEAADKATLPFDWRAGGVGRGEARLISQVGGGPAYGGTPADRCVLQAIAALKARGLKVTLYPFVMMDVPPGNGLADPYGAGEQAAFPWRGRITCHPAAGQAGSPDRTAAAETQVAAFFGETTAEDFTPDASGVAYDGPDEWGFRRFILHYAHLAHGSGGVDAFLLGSELRGLTTVRDGASSYPAVTALKDLAAEARAVLGSEVALSYAADWSEYCGHRPTDGSGDVHFHLDPLWADGSIDFVGVDWYPPLTDWRDGRAHLDAAEGWQGPRDLAYLGDRAAGGEGFDWYYASEADRLAQTRTAITDPGGYGEPWVFRVKDLRSWWENPHHDRPGGVRVASTTAWAARSKPVRLVEVGCPAVDKGANSPNLFFDPKSAESALPPFSRGARDDLQQRRALEAWFAHFGEAANNPVSPVYGGQMVAGLSAWCWDARPYPDFPARAEVWKDAPNWRLGHWLNGRLGAAGLPELVAALAERGGVEVNAGGLEGSVIGFVVERPMRLRDAIAPLGTTYAFDGCERGGEVAFLMRDAAAGAEVTAAELALPEDREAPAREARTLEPSPDEVRVRFIDEGADYQTGAVVARVDAENGGGGADLDLPIVMQAGEAEAAGWRALRMADAREAVTLRVGPLVALSLEPGDVVTVEGSPSLWRVERAVADEEPRLELSRAEAPEASDPPLDWRSSPPVEVAGPPALQLLDLPPLAGFEADARPLAALAVEPWRAQDLYAGASAAASTRRATASAAAVVGETLNVLAKGPLHRWDEAARLLVRLAGGRLESRSEAEVLAGANAAAVLTPSGEWEVVQFLNAQLVAADTYELSGLLRGQMGTDAAMAEETPAGAAFVLLTRELARAEVGLAERGLPLLWRTAPAGAPPGGLASTEAAFTWSGLHYRAFAPSHLRAERRADGDVQITWARRARIGGDSWEAEPPLSEEREAYLVEVLDGDEVVRTAETATPAFTYSAAAQTANFGGPAPEPLSLSVRQWSAVYGWGTPTKRAA
ncbi:MAG TPA: glycoside hydrolase/phage tail family protein [Caulobacteraceae bacterium]|jgi:hypothetical protein